MTQPPRRSFLQRGGGHAGAREEQFLAGGDGGLPVPRVGQRIDQHLLLVGPPLMGDGLGTRARDVRAIGGGQGNGVGDGTAKQHGAVGCGFGFMRGLVQRGGLSRLLAQHAAHAGERLERGGRERAAAALHGSAHLVLPSASR